MIPLRGAALGVGLDERLTRTIWRLAEAGSEIDGRSALLVEEGQQPPDGFPLYVRKAGAREVARPWVQLPPELGYLRPGDIVGVSPDGTALRVLWRARSRYNSILLTERCDNYCLMCSQPPKERYDNWLLDQAREVVSLLPADTQEMLFTGGEPTLYGAGFIDLLRLCKAGVPETEVHILTNGRRFADLDFALAYAEVDNPRSMAGIPIYGAEASLHDYIVQAPGAFEETVRGILNLAQLEQRIEVRVVVQKHTAPALVEIAEFIARNLPFVEQVALMGLEMIGLARSNADEVWIDPYDYREALSEAALLLDATGIRTLVYNHQLCLLERRAWPFAVRSISDWKNEYDAACASCSVLGACGGFFSTGKSKTSSHIRAVAVEAAPGGRSASVG